MFHFPEQQQLTLRCQKNNTWTTRVETLIGSGLLMNTSGCAISTDSLRTLPELRIDTETSLNAPYFYIPETAPVLADEERQTLEEVTPTAVTQLDGIMSRVRTRQQTLDVSSLLHLHRTSSQQQQQQTYGHVVTIVASCCITLLVVLCFSVRSRLYQLARSCLHKATVPESDAVNQSDSPVAPAPVKGTRRSQDVELKEEVTFATYAMPT